MKKNILIIGLLLLVLIVKTNFSFAALQTIEIPPQFHPLNEPLIAVINLPDMAQSGQPIPACLVVHGSGGIFSEGIPGDSCDTSPGNMSDNFNQLMNLMDELGVAAIAPSSFVSRDYRFCEDNDDDFFQFVAPPFHNPNDGIPMRNSYYKMRRIIIRTLDMLATYNYLCSLNQIDCNRTCMVGTSNGGSSIMSYIANDIGRHIKEYTDISQQREHESNSGFNDRITAFENFPNGLQNIEDMFSLKTEPLFVSSISPGCTLRKVIPTVTTDDSDFDPVSHLFDLYYPSGDTELHLEIGTDDDVPDACYNGGVRQLQAADFESILDIPASQSHYLISTHEGAGHNLLGETVEGASIREKINHLAIKHFYLIFKSGMD